jgi:hypothetical protein
LFNEQTGVRVVLRLGSLSSFGKAKETRFLFDAIDVKVKLWCFRIAIYLQYVSNLLAYSEKQRQSSVYAMTIRHALYMLDKQNNPILATKFPRSRPTNTLGRKPLGHRKWEGISHGDTVMNKSCYFDVLIERKQKKLPLGSHNL